MLQIANECYAFVYILFGMKNQNLENASPLTRLLMARALHLSKTTSLEETMCEWTWAGLGRSELTTLRYPDISSLAAVHGRTDQARPSLCLTQPPFLEISQFYGSSDSTDILEKDSLVS